MPAKKAVRLATFNCENLFARFKFKANVNAKDAVQNGWNVDVTKFDIFNPTEKKLTGAAIKAIDADVIALQEVENLDALKRFRSIYLGGAKKYPYAIAVDGNDPRLIDVAVLSKYPLVHIRSYQELMAPGGKSCVFSRDCLEVDVLLPNGKTLTLFVNHFKSMLDKANPKIGRQTTRAKRMLQAKTVKEIVTDRFGKTAGKHPFVILGDLNDYLQSDEQGKTGVSSLVKWNQVENVVNRLPEAERWTHFWKNSLPCRQLDYLLVSKSLATANKSAIPSVERRGLPKSAKIYTGTRFSGVGQNGASASDHCPLAIDLKM